ncbi:MAG: sulfatase-like hydrolase/transferase [Bdellovibrionota bacterium]
MYIEYSLGTHDGQEWIHSAERDCTLNIRCIFRIIVLFFYGIILASCRVEEKNSILILTFEHLNSLENICNREKNSLRNSGFLELCPESIRFTHAYVPSTLTLPNLSTLLTGLYPYQHQVRHNGPPGLNSEFVTIAEVALQNNFRTAFFSGGPPVFRKSGLNQGFELFNENLKITSRTIHNPFFEQVLKFREWLSSEVKNQGFLAAFYIPDLLFKDSTKTNDLGEARSLGFENQLEEIDESLFQLISTMKKAQTWNKTTVILMGLNGRPNPERTSVIQPLNLHSENVQVTLLIKPSYSSQSSRAQRTFDDPVSMADVGRTVFELLGQGLRKKIDSEAYFPALSLKPNIESTSAPWPGQRAIPIESGWLLGHNFGQIRSGVVLNHELIFFDEKPKYFNTLTDRLESRPNVFHGINDKQISVPIQNLIKIGYKAWKWPDSLPVAQFQIPQELWWRSENENKLLERIDQITKSGFPSSPLDSWAALISMRSRQTKKLSKFIKRLNNPGWSYEKNSCYQLSNQMKMSFTERKNCRSKLFLLWLDWNLGENRKTESELVKTSFFKSLAQLEIKRRIQKINWGLNLIWNDYSLSVPEINELDLILTKPEFVKDRLLFSRTLENLEILNQQDSAFY